MNCPIDIRKHFHIQKHNEKYHCYWTVNLLSIKLFDCKEWGNQGDYKMSLFKKFFVNWFFFRLILGTVHKLENEPFFLEKRNCWANEATRNKNYISMTRIVSMLHPIKFNMVSDKCSGCIEVHNLTRILYFRQRATSGQVDFIILNAFIHL